VTWFFGIKVWVFCVFSKTTRPNLCQIFSWFRRNTWYHNMYWKALHPAFKRQKSRHQLSCVISNR